MRGAPPSNRRKLRRRFGRMFGWPYPLMLFAVFWAPLLVVLWLFADSISSYPYDGKTSLLYTLEDYWMVLLAPLITTALFWPLLRAMRRTARRLAALFRPLDARGQELFLQDAKAMRKNRGFYCGELGVWFSAISLGRVGCFGAVMIPWRFFAGARPDPRSSGRLLLADSRGEEFVFKPALIGKNIDECRRALAARKNTH